MGKISILQRMLSKFFRRLNNTKIGHNMLDSVDNMFNPEQFCISDHFKALDYTIPYEAVS